MPDNSELVNALSGGGLLSSIANPRVLSPNLLGDSLGRGSEIANSMWRNKLVQSQQAVGQNLLAATGQDGTVDTGKLAALNAQDPNTALSAGASAQAGQGLRSNDMGFNQAQQGAIGRSVGSVLTLPDAQQTPENYKQMLDYSLANHGIDQAHYTSAMQALAGAGSDPGALRQFGTKLLVGTLAGPEMAQTVLPSNQTASTGGTIQPQVRQPALLGGGVTNVPGAVPMTPTPAERNTTQPTWNPVTRQFEATPRQNVAPMVDGQGAPVPGSAVPGLPTSGRLAAPGATAAPTTATNITQPPPGTADEMQGSAAHLVAARADANSYQQRIQPIEGAITALAGSDTGKGGETLNTIRAYTQDVAPRMLQAIMPSTLMDTGARQAFDEANKYLTSMAINAPGGARSNAGQEAAGAATPSVHISNAAAQLVARAALAQQRLTQVGTLAFNQSGQPAGNYDTFMNTWNTNQDPRGFIADRMSGPERAAMVKQMGGNSTPAYQRYKASYLAAQAAKVTDAPTN